MPEENTPKVAHAATMTAFVRAAGSDLDDRRALTNAESHNAQATDHDHSAPFAGTLADDYVLCYSPPGGLIVDPFVGSGTVAFAVHRAGAGRRFIGGDLGVRKMHNGRECGRHWADIVNDCLRQGRLFS